MFYYQCFIFYYFLVCLFNDLHYLDNIVISFVTHIKRYYGQFPIFNSPCMFLDCVREPENLD